MREYFCFVEGIFLKAGLIRFEEKVLGMGFGDCTCASIESRGGEEGLLGDGPE